ncbi:hypothetical protein ACHAXS_002801 [Conticribra weissflogii]
MNAITNQTTKPLLVGATLLAISSVVCYSIYSLRKKTELKGSSHNSINRRDRHETDCHDVVAKIEISEVNLPPHIRREIEKERRFEAKKELISMKSPMYDNVFMLDNDREPMCTISLKKARWYVRKGIAEWSSFQDHGNRNTRDELEEAKCIRLLFEPSGGNYQNTGTPENLYLKSAKQNVCVACGSTDHHMRHYIVPYAYRTLLPDQYKTHMSHDIVILCPECHVSCEKLSKAKMKSMEDALRDDLSKEVGNVAFCPPVIDDADLHHVRSCAIALARWRDTMPEDKIEAHEKVVRGYLAGIVKVRCSGKTEVHDKIIIEGEAEAHKKKILDKSVPLTKEQLQKACSVNYRVKNPQYISGSELVVQSLNGDAKKIEKFVVDWRKHFIDTVNPKFMPVGWCIDNPVVCGRQDGENGGDVNDVKRW